MPCNHCESENQWHHLKCVIWSEISATWFDSTTGRYSDTVGEISTDIVEDNACCLLCLPGVSSSSSCFCWLFTASYFLGKSIFTSFASNIFLEGSKNKKTLLLLGSSQNFRYFRNRSVDIFDINTCFNFLSLANYQYWSIAASSGFWVQPWLVSWPFIKHVEETEQGWNNWILNYDFITHHAIKQVLEVRWWLW